MPRDVRPHVPPRFDLWIAQRAIATYRFPVSVLRRAKEFMEDYESDKRVIRQLKKLFASLTWNDFAWRDVKSGGDVYGKVDKYGLWYIKFALKDGMLRVMSMHEAENSMDLYRGETLRRRV